MKSLFNDLQFKESYALGSVNSINWARVLAQIVYYFHSGLRVLRVTGAAKVQFSVPTGNFGDIFAGYLAARMGLPVSRLILATNENDILARFFQSGVYAVGPVKATISPSMDIQVASNFERYLYYRVGEDSRRLRTLMERFSKVGALTVTPPAEGEDDGLIVAGAGNTQSTLETIRGFHEQYAYLLDPHSAVGVHVGLRHRAAAEPLICLATAHPAKFGDAIRDAIGYEAAHHPVLEALKDLPTRCDVLPASAPAVKEYMRQRIAL
jgi:threonine synthase